ncbi:MAG: lipoate--protein ligase family protein [Candidatus Saganbacteria bacterium]|nr:lipoate--protein ligase family protein [Candidatus Saganbacteria bacterium]
MDIDRDLFKKFEKNLIPPTLRIYRWKAPCISVGYFQRIEGTIDHEKGRELGIDIVKRPTGGGILLHNEVEVTYSIVASLNGDMIDAYKRISQAVISGLKKLGINAELSANKNSGFTELCYSFPASYEITFQGKKLVGAAQRKGRRGFLQQGSIFVENDMEKLFSVLKNKNNEPVKVTSIKEILGKVPDFKKMKDCLISGFKEAIRIDSHLSHP